MIRYGINAYSVKIILKTHLFELKYVIVKTYLEKERN